MQTYSHLELLTTPDLRLLIHRNSKGLLCKAGSFYIDPWKPVETAVITHAHADHARSGCEQYICHKHCVPILKKRLGKDIRVRGLEYRESVALDETRISLHSAGHILGSAQVRVEFGGEVWVASGDYKRDPDPSCAPFEVVSCDTFITEATFALPIYRWPATSEVAREIYGWWQENAANGLASVLFCYSLGKAQRVLAELLAYTDRKVLLHGAVVELTQIYRDAGIHMLPTEPAVSKEKNTRRDYSGELIIAPPGASGSTWMRRFGKFSDAFCSGWMAVRGNRRRRGYDRGFVISDHADWHSLIKTIKQTGAQRVLATHGNSDLLVRYLREQGMNANALNTFYGDEKLEQSPHEAI